ncbi:hypothetical protein IE53DRAFT_321349, partial [Violaceomyces palustris]
LWEKKYGRNANHIKLREKGPVAKGGSSLTPIYGKGEEGGGWASSSKSNSKGGRRKPLPPQETSAPKLESGSKKEEEQQLHPSWIAKQKQKEKLANLTTSAPAGKKITFD